MSTIVSRRRFAQLLGAGAVLSVARPALSFAKPVVAAPPHVPATSGVVRLSSNENPYGPSPKALKAMNDVFNLACRYPDEHNDLLIDAIAKLNGVNHDQILLGDGSSEILQLCADTFTGPGRGNLVAADPTFEAILNNAAINGAEVVKVPLTPTFGHDLAKMTTAAKQGLIYVCNPNNPTASITPKSELREFIANAPRETMILVDEAYFHYADSPHYESVIPLIKDHPNLIVARTFSKIYGMAGLRCGYCVANLNDPDQVANSRRLTGEAKTFVISELDRMGYKQIPSQANFIMFDVKRPVVPLIKALKERNVHVGRLFPALPNHMRLTIGKKTEMETFLAAFRQVTA
jgi:histidinol-phosphate aminotransferase